MKLEDHPTVRHRSKESAEAEDEHAAETTLEGAWLRRLAMDCGADDTGLVEIGRPALEPQRDEIFRNYPWTTSLLSLVVQMAREPVRGAPRSVANLEFPSSGLSGNVKMAVEDVLTEQDKAEGYILACQARIRSDVIVDA